MQIVAKKIWSRGGGQGGKTGGLVGFPETSLFFLPKYQFSHRAFFLLADKAASLRVDTELFFWK